MRWWDSLLGLLLLVGCATSPERVEVPESIPVPVAWESAPEAVASDGVVWWDSFGSGELGALLDEAWAGNPDIQVLRTRVEAAAATVRIAGAGLYPSVTAGLDGARRKQNFIGFPIPGSTSNVLSTQATTYGLSLATSWEIDLWGRRRAGKRAAIADAEAAAWDWEMQRLSLSAQVSKAWINAMAAKDQWALARASAKSFEETAAKIRDRYEQGLRSALELKLSMNSVESARALVLERQQQLVQANQALELLLGRYPSGRIDLTGEFPEIIGGIEAGIPSRVLLRRPDLMAAERRLAAADQRLWESKAALFPQISLSGSTGTSTAELRDVVDTDFSVWTLAGNLAQPIFQGGRLLAGVDVSKAQVKEATFSFVSTALQAFGEVEFGLTSESILKQREEHTVAAAAQSASALALANRRYESGLEELISVLESQRRSLSDATQVIVIRQARLSNRIDLYLALGGGAGHDGEVVELVDENL